MRRRTRWLGIALILLIAAGGSFAFWLSHDKSCAVPASIPAGAVTMQAVHTYCYGSTDLLVPSRVVRPTPADDELLVRVHAAGVNPLDWHYLHGEPYIMRMSSGVGRPDSPLFGVDFAGTVEAVGSAVRNFRPGDAVFGGASGAYADYVVVRESRTVALKPDDIGFEEAASVPIAAITALQAVRDGGNVQAGQRVLINGASGGVGTFAVQIAKAMGAHVTGVCSTRNVELVRSIGADAVIDYTQTDFTAGDARYDVIVDMVGNRSLSAYRRVLADDGALVMVTGPKSNRWLGPIGRMLWAGLTSPFVSQRQVTVMSRLNSDDLAQLRGMLGEGTLRPIIDRRFTGGLAQVGEAIDYLQQGRTRGKNVIVLIPD